MSQSSQSQAKAQGKWAKSAMGTQRTNEKARDQVAPALKPNVAVGATKHNQEALIKNKKIENAFGSSPESVKFS